MHWEFLIPVIAIIVFILSSLLRGAEDEAPRRPGARPNKPATDMDRFLEEMNRRRRQAGGKAEVPTGERLPVPPRPQPQPSRGRPPERARPAPPPAPVVARVPPPPPPPAPPRPPAIPAAVVVAQAVPVAAPVQAVAAIQAVQPPPAIRRVDAPEVASPTLARVVAMLQTPQNLQAVFLLREVLGEPLCRRPRRL